MGVADTEGPETNAEYTVVTTSTFVSVVVRKFHPTWEGVPHCPAYQQTWEDEQQRLGLSAPAQGTWFALQVFEDWGMGSAKGTGEDEQVCSRVNSSDNSVGAVCDFMMGDIWGGGVVGGELNRKNQIRSLIVKRGKGS